MNEETRRRYVGHDDPAKGVEAAKADLRFWHSMRSLAVDAAKPGLLRHAKEEITEIEDFLAEVGERPGEAG